MSKARTQRPKSPPSRTDRQPTSTPRPGARKAAPATRSARPAKNKPTKAPATTATKPTKPTATKPTAAEPTATKPTATKPKATKPKATKPKATKPKATRPKAAKPKATRPKASGPAKPRVTGPASKPVATTASKPRVTRPASKPEASKSTGHKARRGSTSGKASKARSQREAPGQRAATASAPGEEREHRGLIEQAQDELAPALPFETSTRPMAFPAEPDVEARFRRLLREDPQRNLIERYDYLLKLNESLTEDRLGYTRPIVAFGWSVLYFKAEKADEYDLTYTVGLYYRYRTPELMVLTKGVDVERIKRALNRLGCAIALEEEIDWSADQGDDADMPWLRFASPSEAQLERYPFGLGHFFYRCMMDAEEVPLLLCQLTPD